MHHPAAIAIAAIIAVLLLITIKRKKSTMPIKKAGYTKVGPSAWKQGPRAPIPSPPPPSGSGRLPPDPDADSGNPST
jgi:hypothetical protein